MSTATAPTTQHTESTDAHTADNHQQQTAEQQTQDQAAAVVVIELDPGQVAQHPENMPGPQASRCARTLVSHRAGPTWGGL